MFRFSQVTRHLARYFLFSFLLPLLACSKGGIGHRLNPNQCGDGGSKPNTDGFDGICSDSGPTPDPKITDDDEDGATADVDCDDHNPRRAPYMYEWCDGIDNNCDGLIDEPYGLEKICLTGDPCQPFGRIRCRDEFFSSCQWDDVGCL